MKDRILVRWFVKDSGSVRGEAVSGLPQPLRYKVIRADRWCFGFSPKHQEVTEVEIVEDLNPGSLQGTIFVRPIFERPSNALPPEEAIKKMVELLSSKPRGAKDTYIEVDLMGWRGAITFAVCKASGPLTVHWIYHAADGKEQIAIPVTNVLTTAVTHDRGTNRIIDWKLASQDLGEPYEIEVDRPNVFVVRWPGITAEMSEVVALAGVAHIQRIRLERAQVVADLTIAVTNGTKSIILGEAERLEGYVVRYVTMRKECVALLPEADRQSVEMLLKSTRHSLSWHHEHALRQLVEEDLPGTVIWEQIDQVMQFVKGFGTSRAIREGMRRLDELREAIDDLRTSTLTYGGDRDPILYDADKAPELELSSLIARNAHELQELDEALSDLRDLMGEVMPARKTQEYRERAMAEADRLMKVAADPKVSDVPRVLPNVRYWSERAKVYIRTGNLEDALDCLHKALEALHKPE